MLRNSIELVSFVLAAGSYWLVSPLVPQELLFQLMNGALVCLIAGYFVHQVPNFLKAVSLRPWGPGHYLAGGVIITAVGLFGISLGNLIARLQDGTLAFWENSYVRGWMFWLLVISYSVKMLSRGVVDGEGVSRSGWFRVGLFVVVGLVLAVLSLVYAGRLS